MHPAIWLKSITEDGRKRPRTKPSVMDWCVTNRLDYSYMRQMFTGKQVPPLRVIVQFYVLSGGMVTLDDWLELISADIIKYWLTPRATSKPKPLRVRVPYNKSSTHKEN